MIPSSNGHQNGHTNGGEGGTAPSIMQQPGGRVRESLRVIQRAVVNGWKIPDDWLKTLPQVAATIAADPNRTDRDRLRALEVLRGMAGDSVQAAIALDKIERLDNGDPTERVSVLQFNIIESEPKHARTLDDGNEDG